ncbi:triose-phosphate isomerase [Candidatus Woesearchaeota archaeon]|nr:triose-phosphate isomerase [Candidatus Woesearchaeota archaeon]
MTRPLILINFKLYKESVGSKGLELARKIAKVKRSKYEIAIAPSLLTTKEIVDKVNISVFAQHCSKVDLGAHTGKISVIELKKIGVKGTILNHSERKIPMKFLKVIIESCHKQKLQTVVCASTLGEIKKVAKFKPTYIAYEPKRLIGTNISVTNSKPKIIVKAVELVHKLSKNTRVLCGAGIHTQEDIGQALLLGTTGVLIGHAVPKAKDPKKFLEKLLS